MLYRNMKRSERSLSVLGFGCMRLPVKSDSSVDREETKRLLRRATDSGVNYLDTAYTYHNGQSETVLGEVLKDGYREKVNLATKLPSWLINTRQDMDKYLDEQLSRLQTDHIDFYMLHGLNKSAWEKLKKLGACEFLDSALRDGRIMHAGFSFHHTVGVFKEIIDSYPWDFCQIQYNFLDEEYQAGTEGLRYAAAKGIGVIAMEPLRGGLLAKDIPGLREIWSCSNKSSPAQWGLRWVWDHPEVIVALSGMNTMAQLSENLDAAKAAQPNSLSREDLGLIEVVKAFYQKRMKVGCTCCGYCLPCPSGVDIPECFNQYNKAHVFDALESAKNLYTIFIAKEGAASKCTECNACLERCPQHIAIPEKLKEVVKCFGK
jgi:hypothetical protein